MIGHAPTQWILPMMRAPRFSIALALALFGAACASNASHSAADHVHDAPAAAQPAAEHAGHDMSGMDARKAAELAFLFPDGNDKGWSGVENGMGHYMGAEVPMSQLPAATRVELLRQL